MSARRPLAVRPSVAFILALLLVLPPAMLRGNNMLVLLSVIVIAAALAGLLVPRLTLRGMGLRRLLPGHGTVGEPMRIRYRIHRRSSRGLPAFAVGVEEALQGVPVEVLQQAWVLHVAAGDTVHGDLELVPMARGRIELTGARLATGFPFGLRRSRRAAGERREVVVHPRAERLSMRMLHAVRGVGHEGPRSGRQRGQSDEWFATRPARPGDRLRDIAWRISAHRDELIAVERAQAQLPRVRVVLDLRRATVELDGADHQANRAMEEDAITLCASLLHAAHDAGDEVGLVIAGLPGVHEPRRGTLHLERMLTTLALLDLDAERSAHARLSKDRSGAVVVQPDRIRPVPGLGDAMHLSARVWRAGRHQTGEQVSAA